MKSEQPFQRIAARYRMVNRAISFGLDGFWRRSAVRELELTPGMTVLDIGSGPGEMLEAIWEGVVRIGLDPSSEMMKASSHRFNRIKGAGEELPLRNGCVDRVTSAFTLRNLTNRRKAFTEMARVLRAGGRGAIMDFSPPEEVVWNLPVKLYLKYGIPLIGGVLSGDSAAYKYLSDTIIGFPGPEKIAAEFREAGFIEVYYRRLVGGVNVLYTFRKAESSESCA